MRNAGDKSKGTRSASEWICCKVFARLRFGLVFRAKWRLTQVAEEGLEQNHVTRLHNNELQIPGFPFGPESGPLQDETAHFPPDLSVVVEAWPTLPEAVRAGILAMVRAAGGVAR